MLLSFSGMKIIIFPLSVLLFPVKKDREKGRLKGLIKNKLDSMNYLLKSKT